MKLNKLWLKLVKVRDEFLLNDPEHNSEFFKFLPF